MSASSSRACSATQAASVLCSCGALRLAHPAVGDVADQPVREAERALAGDRRERLRARRTRARAARRGASRRRGPARARRARRARTRGRSSAALLEDALLACSRARRSVRRSSACTESGIRFELFVLLGACARSPRGRAGCPRLFSSASARCAGGTSACASRASTSSPLSAASSGAELDATRARVAAAPGRPIVEQVRAGDARRSAPATSRSARARCSITSSSGSSAQWTSSKTSTSGCASRELLGPERHCPGQLAERVLILGRAEHAERDREQVGDGLALAAHAELLERLVRAGRRR